MITDIHATNKKANECKKEKSHFILPKERKKKKLINKVKHDSGVVLLKALITVLRS